MPKSKQQNSKKPLVLFDKFEQLPGETIEHYYRRLAKQADQRLVRLEAYSHEQHFKKIKNWSYKKAIKDIQHWSGENATRFNTAPPETKQQLEAKLNDIKQFLQAPTSTKSGVLKTYKKRADSINQNQGTNLTWEQLADLFENDETKDLINNYDSGETLRVFSEIKNNKVKVLDPNNPEEAKEIEEADKKIVELIELNDGKIIQVEDAFIGDAIKEMIENNDLSIDFINQGGKG